MAMIDPSLRIRFEGTTHCFPYRRLKMYYLVASHNNTMDIIQSRHESYHRSPKRHQMKANETQSCRHVVERSTPQRTKTRSLLFSSLSCQLLKSSLQLSSTTPPFNRPYNIETRQKSCLYFRRTESFQGTPS